MATAACDSWPLIPSSSTFNCVHLQAIYNNQGSSAALIHRTGRCERLTELSWSVRIFTDEKEVVNAYTNLLKSLSTQARGHSF